MDYMNQSDNCGARLEDLQEVGNPSHNVARDGTLTGESLAMTPRAAHLIQIVLATEMRMRWRLVYQHVEDQASWQPVPVELVLKRLVQSNLDHL